MVTKTKISIGILILILLSTGITYVEWSNNARVRIDNDKSTFYVPHETSSWMWVVAGREYNKLYDGSSLMNRDVSNIKVETTYNQDTIIIKRTTPFKRGPVVIDTYLFDGKNDDIELFPISHEVEIFNASGKFYRYEVKDLVYDGETFKLENQTSMGFGRNMKITWWKDYRLGWVYKTGSMYVKSEKLDSDYEVFDVRLFDPTQASRNLNLYLNGLNQSRKYEYYTTANITANVTGCSNNCTICIDINNSINNVSKSIGQKNYTCANQSVSVLYNITTLRMNEFNDTTRAKNLTANGSLFINVDNQTDIDSLRLNITNIIKGWVCEKPPTKSTSSLGDGKQGIAYNVTGNNQWILLSFDSGLGNKGLEYNGSSWVSNSSLYAGDTSSNFNGQAEIFFNTTGNELWDMYVGRDNNITGYFWNGTGWDENSSYLSGINVASFIGNGVNFRQITPTINYNFDDNGKITMILTDAYYNGSYFSHHYGYTWNGTGWEQNNSIVSGIANITGEGEVLTILINNLTNEGYWNLIVTEDRDASPLGYYWNGSSWKNDSTIVIGLNFSDLGGDPASNIKYNVYNDNRWILFSADSSGSNKQCYLPLFPYIKHPHNITIDVNKSDNILDVVLLGTLSGTNLYRTNFYSNNSAVSIINLSRSTAGTKTIYSNITTSGFGATTPISTFKFQLTGFQIDAGNSNVFEEFYNNTNNVSLSKTTATTYWMWDDMNYNKTAYWTSSESGTANVNGSNGKERVFDVTSTGSCTGGGGTGCDFSDTDWGQEVTINFDAEESSRVMFKAYCGLPTSVTENSCGGGSSAYAAAESSGKCEYWLSGSSDQLIAVLVGSGTSQNADNSTYEILKANDTTGLWKVYNDGYYERDILIDEENIELKFRLTTEVIGYVSDGCNPGTVSSKTFNGFMHIYYINTTGVGLTWNGTSYNNTNQSLTSKVVYNSTLDIQRVFLEAEQVTPTGTNVTYYVSNNNGTNWQVAVKDTFTAFATTGSNLSYRVNLTSNNVNETPRVRNIKLSVIPSSVSNISLDVGADGTTDWSYNNTLNASTSPQNFSGTGNATHSYVTSNCKNVTTCYVPTTVTFGTSGVIQIHNYNLTLNPNPINLSNTSLIEDLNLIELILNFTSGSISLSDLKLDFFGSKTINIFAHFFNDTGFNDSFDILVRYSKFNISLPANVSYWEVFPTSKDSKNVTPYGQSNTTPAWNITSYAYDDSMDVYVKTNVTLNACMNITFSNTSTKLGVFLNTTSQKVYSNLSTSGIFGIWNFVDLENCTSRYELPYFEFLSICTDCVRSKEWENDTFTIIE